MDQAGGDDDMHCQNCFAKYDTELHLPRVINQCGHTICSFCLSNEITKARKLNNFIFLCPEDKVQIDLYQKSTESFTVNQLLVRMICREKKTSCSQKREQFNLMPVNVSLPKGIPKNSSMSLNFTKDLLGE